LANGKSSKYFAKKSVSYLYSNNLHEVCRLEVEKDLNMISVSGIMSYFENSLCKKIFYFKLLK
jgi:hypothetical protein